MQGPAEDNILSDQQVSLSSELLCKYLDDGEALEKAWSSGFTNSLKPGVQKRRRAETPPEELASSNKAAFQLQKDIQIKLNIK